MLGWLGLVQPAGAQPLQPVPELTARVIDTTGTLDAAQKAAIEAKLAALEQEKGSQLVVLMVNTTAPEDIAAYANRVGNAWKIGRRDVGDGVILLVALKDRRVRIEVAKTLEGAIPDLMAKRVIDDALTPRFRQGDFAGGIEAAVDQLSALVRGEALPPVTSAGTAGGRPGAVGGAFSLAEMAIFLFIAMPVVAGIARASRAQAGRPAHGRRRWRPGLGGDGQPADRAGRGRVRAGAGAVLGADGLGAALGRAGRLGAGDSAALLRRLGRGRWWRLERWRWRRLQLRRRWRFRWRRRQRQLVKADTP